MKKVQRFPIYPTISFLCGLHIVAFFSRVQYEKRESGNNFFSGKPDQHYLNWVIEVSINSDK